MPSFQNERVLQLQYVEESDFTTYTCCVGNGIGEEQCFERELILDGRKQSVCL